MKRKQRIVLFAVFAVLMGVPLLMGIRDKALDIWAATENAAGTWVKVGEKWWYKHTDGTYTKSDWEKINNRWYYFDASGWMVTGWLNVGTEWYYLCPEKTDRFVEGECWTGWLKDGSLWYYLSPAKTASFKFGQMMTGWVQISGSWYYLNPTKTTAVHKGQMMTGWLTLSEKKYYLAENGVMLTGEVIMDGKKYTFNSSGALTSEVSAESLSNGEKIAAAALNAINTSYVKDGENLSTGCDNDGFIYAVLVSCGYTVPKTMEEQLEMGTAVQDDALQPGDVILYEGDVDYGAIYLGDNRVIYMSGQRFGVRMVPLDHLGEWRTGRRVY